MSHYLYNIELLSILYKRDRREYMFYYIFFEYYKIVIVSETTGKYSIDVQKDLLHCIICYIIIIIVKK